MNRRIVFKNLKYRLVALVLILVVSFFVRSYIIANTNTTCFIVRPTRAPETEIGNRDISLYEFGGYVGNCVRYETKGDAVDANVCKTREDARAFILDHFKAQRRGYVIVHRVSLYSITPTYFFIEPDVAGNWEIHTRELVLYRLSFDSNVNTMYWTEAFRRTLKDGYGDIKPGTSVLVLRSRGVYELTL